MLFFNVPLFNRPLVCAALTTTWLITGSNLVRVSEASIGEVAGYGSRSAGLAGASAAWGFGPFGAYSNPAGMPLSGEKRLTIGWKLLFQDPIFKPISNILVENNYLSDKERSDSVVDDYRNVFGQAMGFTYKLFPQMRDFTIGLTAFLPVEEVAYMDTGETFVPEYVMHRSRATRPQFFFASGGNIFPESESWPGVYLGASLSMAYTLTGRANVMINTAPDKPSQMRFSTALKPKYVPAFSLLVTKGQKQQDPSDIDRTEPGAYSFGLVVRLPVEATSTMKLASGARVFGNFATVDFMFTSMAALFYDPLTVEFGSSFKYASFGRAFLQVDFQNWTKFIYPAMNIAESSSDCTAVGGGPCGVNISGGKIPTYGLKNIWVPRIAHELSIGSVTWRAGYSYRPSIFTDLPTGIGNYLDPPRHMFTTGAGLHFDGFFGQDAPHNIDFHLSYHQLITQEINKTPGDELGNAGKEKIGSPGYEAGGYVLGGGVSLTFAF